MNKIVVAIISLVITSTFAGKKENLQSGNPIKSNTANGIGVFSPPGINATPLGLVYLKNQQLPTLFVSPDRRYEGILRYNCVKFENGVPVFGAPTPVTIPAEIGNLSPGSMLEYNNHIYTYWLKGNTIFETQFDEQKNSFLLNRKITLKQLPRNARSVQVSVINGKLEGFVEVSDGVSSNAPVHWIKDRNFAAYGPDGIFVGNLTYSGIYSFSAQLSDLDTEVSTQPATKLKEVMWGYHTISRINYGNNQQGLLTGSVNGNFLYYKITNGSLSEKHFAVDPDGIAIRHITIGARPTPVADNKGRHLGLIVGGEGGLFYYPHLKMTSKNVPVYGVATSLLAIGADLYGGSLVVPNLSDWDGDGKLDIISGNSAGHILFYKNNGTNAQPAYGIPEYLSAAGQLIHIQPGYNDDIQGPYESRWGYISPTVVDWNNDGLLDIVSNDSRGKHRLFLNIGTKQKPRLAAESPIYLDGLELHGTWRTRPGAGNMGDRMAYITQDAQDQFHIYWQLDTYNVEDGGKLQLEDGSFIDGSHFPNGGGSGRNKFLIVDWDGDGVKDLLIGTPRHSSIPKRGSGMPFYHGDKGAAVLFMKNVGTATAPVFAYPKMLKYKGETIHFVQHECAPAVGDLGEKNGLDLIVGTETGRFIFYERSDLSW